MDLTPLWISLKIAACATLVTFVAGVLAAWGVYRMKRGSRVADGLLTLPMVLPPTVVGFLLLVAFGKNSPLGRFLDTVGLPLIFTWPGAVIAASVVALPLMYRAARGAFEQLDPDLMHCARTLGMGEWRIFCRIMLPNAWPGVLSGTVLSFARSMGEFGATTLLAGNIPGRTQTMALAVYSAVQNNRKDVALRWSLIIMGISFAAIYLMNLSTKSHRPGGAPRRTAAQAGGAAGEDSGEEIEP